MRFNLLLVIAYLFFWGCGENVQEISQDIAETVSYESNLKSAIEYEKLQNRNGLAYLPNKNESFEGWCKRLYDNEQAEALLYFANGRLTRVMTWQENGLPIIDMPIAKKFLNEHVENESGWKDLVEDFCVKMHRVAEEHTFSDVQIADTFDDVVVEGCNLRFWSKKGEMLFTAKKSKKNIVTITHYKQGKKFCEIQMLNREQIGEVKYF